MTIKAKIINLKNGDHLRILKYKNIFTKGYTPNWTEKLFLIKKLKRTVPLTYVIIDTFQTFLKFLRRKIAKGKSKRF